MEKRLQMQSKRSYSMIDERVVQKIKNKLNANSPRVEIKDKKVESSLAANMYASS